MANEEALRQEAIKLYLQGANVSTIARKLNHSRQWVYKWVCRYDESRPDWSSSLSNAPHNGANKTSLALEEKVIETRLLLEKSPHHESGAYAIWHYLQDNGITPPSVATINRITFLSETVGINCIAASKSGNMFQSFNNPVLRYLTNP